MDTDTWWSTATAVAVALITAALMAIAALVIAGVITAVAGRTWA